MKNSFSVIESLMNQKGISKKDLAEIAGVGPSAVTKWASGGSIRIHNLKKIAQFFNVDPMTIIEAHVNADTPEVKQSESAWKERAVTAERKLKSLREAIKHFNNVVSHLEGAL